MKYKKIILIIIVIIGCIFFFKKENTVKNKDLINRLSLDNIDDLMIVAHPDDETIFGGQHLLKKRYLIVCLTNGDNQVRRKEFEQMLNKTQNKGLIFDYPDKTNGKRDNWQKDIHDIKSDIEYLIHKKNWKIIVTHNPDGEYGHVHHQMTSRIVTKSCCMKKLMYFGRYYKKNDISGNMKKISYQDYQKKISLTQLYQSQKKVVTNLEHILIYENWIQAKDWR